MSTTMDCVYLAALAQHKLSNQAGYPDSPLRLLVGHSNLLGALVPELVSLGVWSPDTLLRPETDIEEQGASAAETNFASRALAECFEDDDFDWDSSDSDDDDSAYSSDCASDGAEDEDEGDGSSSSMHADTRPDRPQPRTTKAEDDATEHMQRWLDHRLSYLHGTQVEAARTGSWLTAELGRPQMDKRAPVVVSSERAIAELSTATSSHSRRFWPPPTAPVSLGAPGILVPD